MKPIKYIAIEGNIGSGKTTLAKKLAEKLNCDLLLEEFLNNPFLKNFYRSKKDALAMELFFINARADQFANYCVQPNNNILICDYYMAKSLIFAENNLNKNEFELFKKTYNKIITEIPKPDLLLFLNCKQNNLQDRIKLRSRDFEQNISAEYLNQVQSGYQKFLNQHHEFPIRIIDSDSNNFLESDDDFGTILELILKVK